MMSISEVNVTPVKPHNGLLAFCSFVIDNSFYVGDVAVYSRLDGSGYRLVYPEKVLHNGIKVNCFHPIRREPAKTIEDAVFSVFEGLINKAKIEANSERVP